MRFLTAVALALVMLWVPVDGVAQEIPNPLKGITELDLSVEVAWDDSITRMSEAELTREVERALDRANNLKASDDWCHPSG